MSNEPIIKPELQNFKISVGVSQQPQLIHKRASVLYPIAAICLLVISVFLVYSPVFSNDILTLWDDQWAVTNQYTENGFTLINLRHILLDYYGGQYAPVNQLYYTALYSLFGYNAFWFHAGSVLIHCCNAILCYYLILRLLARTKLDLLYALRIAFFTALLFAVHPFIVEAVAWLSASKIVIYAFFYLLALHAYMSFIQTKKVVYYFLTLLLYIISFGAKDQAVTLPVCMLLFDKYWGRSLSSGRVWWEKIPFFALSLFFGYITMQSQADMGAGILSDRAQYPFYQRIIFACYTLFEYLTKCIAPIKLSYVYPFPNVIGEPVPTRFLFYPILLIAVTFFLWNYWRNRWILFAVIFFLVHIGIVCNIIPLSRFVIVADRYVYIASIGIFFILSFLFSQIVQQKPKYLKFVISVTSIYVVCLAVYSHERCKVWKNTDTLKHELRDLIRQRTDYVEPIN